MKLTSLLRHLTNGLLTLASLAYPLGWLYLSEPSLLRGLIGVMAVLWLLKALQAVSFQRFFAIAMAALLGLIFLSQQFDTMYWYPVIINGVMLVLFGSSLFSAQSLIERLARLQTPNLPTAAIAYTRKVTQMWCGFFLMNIIICTALILTQQYQYWAWYSGGIAYGLMGILMLGEWWVRRVVKK